MKTSDAYAKVTARLIALLEAGTVPWHMPWRTGMPTSIHGRAYRGINAAILAFGSPYTSNVWLTFNQARERGGCVRKGEKGTAVILFKVSKREDGETAEGESRTRLYATTYTVFNIEQCDGVELPKRFAPRGEVAADERAEQIAARYLTAGGPALVHQGSRAAYAPKADKIHMPNRNAFDDTSEYYSTLFHEIGHSTGHAARLNREGVANFDGFASHQYSKEELVAEFCAAYLCAEAGLENKRTIDNSAAYLRSWLRDIKADPGVLVRAASQAQKAADLVLGDAAEEEEREAA